MINSIRIQNFQSHKDTLLNLHKGVNVIVGESDCGKTAILRALRWVVFNKPGGESFRSHWGGDTIVSITKDSETTNRIKTKKENKYTTDVGDSIGQYFYTSLAGKVPEDIQNSLNMSDINFQYQMDAPFLLSSSSGEVARKLNDVVNLNVIGVALKQIEKDKRQVINDLRHTEASLESLDEDLKQYDDLQEREAKIEEIERRCSVLTDIKYKQSALKNTLFSLNDVNKDIETIPDLSEAADAIRQLEQKQKTVEGIQKDAVKLDALLKQLKKEENEIKLYSDSIQEAENEYKELMPDECPLCGQEIKK